MDDMHTLAGSAKKTRVHTYARCVAPYLLKQQLCCPDNICICLGKQSPSQQWYAKLFYRSSCHVLHLRGHLFQYLFRPTPHLKHLARQRLRQLYNGQDPKPFVACAFVAWHVMP
jgi:hypothetical protein